MKTLIDVLIICASSGAAVAQEGMIVEADVVLGDKPSCLRGDDPFSARVIQSVLPTE